VLAGAIKLDGGNTVLYVIFYVTHDVGSLNGVYLCENCATRCLISRAC